MKTVSKVIVSAIAVLMILVGAGYGGPTVSADTYTQQIEITFTDSAKALQALLSICGLYHEYEWAVSARWDDNSPTNIRMMETMDAYGIRGTFFMNGRDYAYWGPKYDYTGTNEEIQGLLLASAGGHSIGGHGWRHGSLGHLNYNRMWAEIMRVRADREASGDCTLCGFSMPNMDWSNALVGNAIAADIAEALMRAGFYFNANANFANAAGATMPAANLLPWDNATVDAVEAQFNQYLANTVMQQSNPNISFSMHAPAHNTEALWDALEQKFDMFNDGTEWWYCNESEYAAYRLQYMLGGVETAVSENVVTVTLTRPLLVELNDDVPLTLKIAGVGEADIVSAQSATATVSVVGAGPEGGVLLDVQHDNDQSLPAEVGWIHNDVSMDADFVAMGGELVSTGSGLELTLINLSAETLEDIRVTFRGPLNWQAGPQVVTIVDLGTGQQVVVPVSAPSTEGGYEYTCGPEFYAAQVDCVVGGTAVRCHFTADADEGVEDSSYPVGRCMIAGSFAPSLYNSDVGAAAAAAGVSQDVELSDGTLLPWESTEEAVNFVSAEGIWGNPPAAEHMLDDYYMVCTTVTSDITQQAAMEPGSVVDMFVNGQSVDENGFELRQGTNSVMMVYNADRKRVMLLRLVSTSGGERLDNISYSLPDSSAPVAAFTVDNDYGLAPLMVNFDASSSVAGAASIVSYEWDFADGNSATGVTTGHTFTAEGDYNVTLTVTDACSLTSSRQKLISVGAVDVNEMGDLDSNGQVDFFDFAMLADYWLTGELTVDIVSDGLIDNSDLAVMAGNWLWGVPVPLVDPTVHYPLDGNVQDIGPWANHGTIIGDPAFVDDRDGNPQSALRFNGNDIVNCGSFDPSVDTGFLTLAFWVYSEGHTSDQMIVAKRSVWNADMMWQVVLKAGTNLLQMANGNNPSGSFSIAQLATLPTNLWTHVAITYDGENATCYINGANPVSGPYVMGTGTGSTLAFGDSYQSGAPTPTYFRGTLDDLRMYNRVLSAAEIADLANN